MIVVNLDVMMAKRKMSLNELSEKTGITTTNLSILKTIPPSINAPNSVPNINPEKTLFLLSSLIALILAPVPNILYIVVIINCIG